MIVTAYPPSLFFFVLQVFTKSGFIVCHVCGDVVWSVFNSHRHQDWSHQVQKAASIFFFIIVIVILIVTVTVTVTIVIFIKVGLTNLRELEFFFVLSFTFSFTEIVWVVIFSTFKHTKGKTSSLTWRYCLLKNYIQDKKSNLTWRCFLYFSSPCLWWKPGNRQSCPRPSFISQSIDNSSLFPLASSSSSSWQTIFDG